MPYKPINAVMVIRMLKSDSTL